MWKLFWSRGEEKAKEEVIELLRFLDKEIKGKKFFGGDNIGFVDITANFIAYWFPIVAEIVGLQILTEDKFPDLCKWANEYCNSSFVKENLPDKDKLFAGFKFALQSGSLY